MPRAQSDASLPLIDPHLIWLARLQRLRGARLQGFCAREVVMQEGDIPETIGVVVEGAVAVSSRTPCGRMGILYVVGPWSLLGYQSVTSEPVPHALPGAFSLVQSTLLTVPVSSVAAVLHHDTLLLRGFTAALGEQLDRAHAVLARALTLSVNERVRHALRDLADRFGTPVPGGTRIMLPLSQDLLASIVGATRESVNRALRELKTAGAVQFDDGEYVWSRTRQAQEVCPGLS